MKKVLTKLKHLLQMFFLFVRVVVTLRVGRNTPSSGQDNTEDGISEKDSEKGD